VSAECRVCRLCHVDASHRSCLCGNRQHANLAATNGKNQSVSHIAAAGVNTQLFLMKIVLRSWNVWKTVRSWQRGSGATHHLLDSWFYLLVFLFLHSDDDENYFSSSKSRGERTLMTSKAKHVRRRLAIGHLLYHI